MAESPPDDLLDPSNEDRALQRQLLAADAAMGVAIRAMLTATGALALAAQDFRIADEERKRIGFAIDALRQTRSKTP